MLCSLLLFYSMMSRPGPRSGDAYVVQADDPRK